GVCGGKADVSRRAGARARAARESEDAAAARPDPGVRPPPRQPRQAGEEVDGLGGRLRPAVPGGQQLGPQGPPLAQAAHQLDEERRQAAAEQGELDVLDAVLHVACQVGLRELRALEELDQDEGQGQSQDEGRPDAVRPGLLILPRTGFLAAHGRGPPWNRAIPPLPLSTGGGTRSERLFREGRASLPLTPEDLARDLEADRRASALVAGLARPVRTRGASPPSPTPAGPGGVGRGLIGRLPSASQLRYRTLIDQEAKIAPDSDRGILIV